MSLCSVCRRNLEENGLAVSPEPWDCGEKGKELDERLEVLQEPAKEAEQALQKNASPLER